MQNIHLSFIEIIEPNFTFTIFRRLYDSSIEINDDIKVYRLPKEEKSEIYEKFYVRINPELGYDIFVCNADTNYDLTKYMLTKIICWKADQLKMDFDQQINKYQNTVEINIDTTNQGKRAITFSAYYLQLTKKFGFLVDVHYKPSVKNHKKTIESQKLSFSLDKYGNINRNFYLDKYTYISKCIKQLVPTFNSLQNDSNVLTLAEEFTSTPVTVLKKKEYVFAKGKDFNQFKGLTKFEPYKKIDDECMFIFIMEDRFRSFANKLYLSLIGKQNPGTFIGMEQVFKLKMSVSNIHRIKIERPSREEIDKAVIDAQELINNNPKFRPVVIFIEENNDEEIDGVSDAYFYIKYRFTKINIPIQVLSHDKISVENTLKWSTSNIGLGLFTKLGGIPWIITPSTSDCLILGIGSAHKILENGSIDRYFAYSVCLDSSGLYKKLEILADDRFQDSYLNALEYNLTNLLQNPEFSNYKKCALHIPFKIRKQEIRSLERAISKVNNMEFKVIKINIKNKFFGFSEHNTKTPYESSMIELSNKDFLIWFEGLQYGRENLNQRISPPVHIEFMNFDNTSKESVNTYLQDIINLTGANWRGFNAKVNPISIYYSSIVAKYCKNFEEYPDFIKETISLETPWFL